MSSDEEFFEEVYGEETESESESESESEEFEEEFTVPVATGPVQAMKPPEIALGPGATAGLIAMMQGMPTIGAPVSPATPVLKIVQAESPSPAVPVSPAAPTTILTSPVTPTAILTAPVTPTAILTTPVTPTAILTAPAAPRSPTTPTVLVPTAANPVKSPIILTGTQPAVTDQPPGPVVARPLPPDAGAGIVPMGPLITPPAVAQDPMLAALETPMAKAMVVDVTGKQITVGGMEPLGPVGGMTMEQAVGTIKAVTPIPLQLAPVEVKTLEELLIKGDEESQEVFNYRSKYSAAAMKASDKIDAPTAVLLGELSAKKALLAVTYPQHLENALDFVNKSITI